MFVFGLFSSYIPYLVILVTYSVYLLLSLGVKQQDPVSAVQSAEKYIHVTAKAELSVKDNDYVAFADDIFISSENERLTIPELSKLLYVECRTEKFLILFKGNHIFSRPPPFAA